MSKSRRKIDPNQLSFAFDRQIQEYTDLKEQLLSPPTERDTTIQDYGEACVELAAAVKRALRATNLSREQLVDAINDYFGWGKEGGLKLETGNSGKHLSIHIFNHYLSKPAEYPMPAFYLFAIQRITESLEPARCLAEAEGAKVISEDEIWQLKFGKLDEMMMELQKLKKELRVRRS